MAAYDEIADTRPRIRRDVLFSRTPTGVLFHNAHGGFNLTTKEAYRFASLIVPHLNGRHSVAEICEGLGDTQRRMVVELVRALYGRGFARAAEPEPSGVVAPEVAARFAAQIGYVDHYTGDAERRFQAFRDTRVAVLGDDLLARWCVLALVRNGCASVGVSAGVDRPGNGFDEVEQEVKALGEAGCPVTVTRLEDRGPAGADWADLDGYDLVLVTGGSAGSRRTVRLLEAGLPDGKRLIPAWTLGERAVIGPLMSAGTTGCWVCAALRLGAVAEAGAAAELWSSLAPLAPTGPAAPRIGRPLAAMLGNLLGYEVFRLTTGALAPETDGRIIVQDLDSLDVVAEPLLPHPRCPRCGDAEAVLSAGLLPDLIADLTVPGEGGQPADGAAEEAAAQAALAELDTRDVLVRPNAGVFSSYADDTWNQTPLKVGTVGLALGPGARREISAFDVHHVAGARLRALYRAAEVYAEHVVPLTGLVGPAEARSPQERRPLVAPASLATGAGTGAGVADVAAWGRAASLLDGTEVLVPAGALRTFGADNHGRMFEATSAGTGAGDSPGAAAARALLSALAHDALRQALRGAPAARVALAGLAGLAGLPDDAELVFLARSAANLGLDLELLELGAGSHGLAPVVLARATDPRTGLPVWAVGSGLRLRHAVLEAVRDLLGPVQLGRDAADGRPADPGDPLIRGLEPSALPVGDGAPLDPAPGAHWPGLLAGLRALGRDALLAPGGASDLRAGRIEVARVLLTVPAATRAN
ncbi:TOMM precursor leader peptide-binding protein [Kitasatospora sp. NBC_00315]|uniref:TOMM precursor leader peptide-binding protein n=1 Tax=Kitasatospora sp. NBC_00315 TaxID=2975963 RepID=UPI003244EB9C